eukprot:603293-Hanusia_phi.AAC.1
MECGAVEAVVEALWTYALVYEQMNMDVIYVCDQMTFYTQTQMPGGQPLSRSKKNGCTNNHETT